MYVPIVYLRTQTTINKAQKCSFQFVTGGKKTFQRNEKSVEAREEKNDD